MRFLGVPSEETDLARAALETRTQADDFAVYGGAFAFDLDELVFAQARGRLLGFWGLTFTEKHVVTLEPEVRDRIGWFLRKVPEDRRFVTDQLSVEWGEHFGLRGLRVRSHPGWLGYFSDAAARQRLGAALVEFAPTDGPNDGVIGEVAIAANDVGVAMLAAIAKIPCVYLATHDWGDTHHMSYNALVRWHAMYHPTGVLVHDREAATSPDVLGRATYVDRSVVDRARADAQLVLATFEGDMNKQMNPDPESIIASIFGGAPAVQSQPSQPGRPYELQLGTVFDPATHYREEYYGDGAGLLYTQPDGTKNLYRGPAHSWEGFEVALGILDQIFKLEGKRLLDVGCGTGDFVYRAFKRGVDAVGIDISEAARRHAAPEVRERVIVGDFTSGSPFAPATFDLVTALDFMEHIWLDDVPTIIRGLARHLVVGGRLFLVICTRTGSEQDWTIKPGDVFTKENSWLLCSGHVTIRRWGWWAKAFRNHGFQVDTEAMAIFNVLKDEQAGFRNVESWTPKNVLVLRKA